MLNCFNLENTLDHHYQSYLSYKLNLNRIFPLVNDNGVFSLNTWLYAFFENVDLVGFTAKSSEFDGNIGCSLDMFNHDLDHLTESINIEKYSDEFQTYKYIYYNILNSDFLIKEQKELYILILWIIIHEYVFDIKFDDPIEKSLKTFISWSYDDIAGEYSVSEFIKYSHIILNNNNIANYMYYFENIQLETNNYSGKRYEVDFNNFLDSLVNRENLTNYNYMFLGIVYFFQDIKDNYDYYTKQINFIC